MTSARVTIGPDGVTYESMGPQRGSASSAASAADDIFTTAVSETGVPVARDQISDDTLLTTPDGIQTTARQLANAGVIAKNPDGSFTVGEQSIDSPQQAPNTNRASEQEAASDEPNYQPLSDEAEELIESTLGMVSDVDVAAALDDVVAIGALSDGVAERLAASMPGAEPEAIHQIFGSMSRVFHTQAADYVLKSTGADLNDVVDWAREHQPEKLKRAVLDQFHGRDLRGYRELAKEYTVALGRLDPQTALRSQVGPGCEVFQDPTNKGQIMVRLPSGMTTTWENYLRIRDRI